MANTYFIMVNVWIYHVNTVVVILKQSRNWCRGGVLWGAVTSAKLHFISSQGWVWPQYFVHITRYVFSCQTLREVSPSMAYPALDRALCPHMRPPLPGEKPCGHRVVDHTLSSARLRRIPLWDLEKVNMGVGTKLQIVDGWQTSFGPEQPGEN